MAEDERSEGGFRVSLLADASLGAPARYGLAALESALEGAGATIEYPSGLDAATGDAVIIAGRGESNTAADLLRKDGLELAQLPESLVVHDGRWHELPLWVIWGADDRGLMYALLDAAERIGWAEEGEEPLSHLEPIAESAYAPERALAKMANARSEFERYYFSEDYWERYFGMMARCRLNTFVLLYGYEEGGYYEPPYPFLLSLDEFPDVRVPGLSEEDQRRNLAMLNRVVEMAHGHGINVTIAIWTHISRLELWGYWTDPSEPAPGTVYGLTRQNLVAYTHAALAELLRRVPGLDGLQFRVHVESALSLPEQIPFWNSVYDAIKEAGREDLVVDMRVKGFTDDMIEAALKSGLNIRLATKFWGEQLGLPYHPTHITGDTQFWNRHGYADLLTYPRRFKMHWRLWNEGTTRVLLWGDPDYGRRFAQSTRLWDGDGFEVQEPLARKMQGHREEETFELLAPEYRSYDWEFERYWHFFQVFGRLGYNPDASPETWHVEFRRRFGPEAGPLVEEALHKASQVLPRIVAYNLYDLSAARFWPEKQRWMDLPQYAVAQPSDTAQFVGIDEAAWNHLHDIESPKIWPEETSAWFMEVADEVERLITQAEERIGEGRSIEFLSTMVDLRALAGLARYHGERIHAGLGYALYKHSGDVNALDDAILYEERAIEAWRGIVAATDGVYNDNLRLGPRPQLTGHWKHELVALEAGLHGLERERAAFQPKTGNVVAAFDFGSTDAEAGYRPVPPDTKGAHYDHIRGGYGWQHAFLSPGPAFQRRAGAKKAIDDFVDGPEPMAYTNSAFSADMPSGHYWLRFVMFDSTPAPRDYGPMWIVANGLDATERFIVPAGQQVQMELETTVTDGRLNVVFNSTTNAKWLVNSMVVEEAGPWIAHVPTRRAVPGQGLLIQATAFGESPIANVNLVYGNRQTGFREIEMLATGEHTYRALVPPAAVLENLSYYIEATDEDGRRATYPAAGGVAPVQIRVTKDQEPPTIAHTPISEATAGEPLAISAFVRDASGVSWVHVRYRGLSQHQDYRTLAMLPTGSGNEYRAVIPGEDIRPTWDLVYYIEAMDSVGNGCIFPDLNLETPYVVVRLSRDNEPAPQ